jgi:hypothetical protein
MAEPYPLQMGMDAGHSTAQELENRVARIQATVERYLPNFMEQLEDVTTGDKIILHQDAFAAGYHYDECTLLGMAIKAAGTKGAIVHVIGTNEETLTS